MTSATKRTRRGGGAWQRRRRRSQEEKTEEDQSLPESLDPAGEVAVCGEDGIEEAQEGEGGAGRRQGPIRLIGGGSKDLDLIQGGGGGRPL